MSEIRDPEAVMTEAELVDAVNKVVEIVGTYSDLSVEKYHDVLVTLYSIANTYTINGHTEYFPVREMRRRKDNE